jgi:membrane associated rhomboid family serine protease
MIPLWDDNSQERTKPFVNYTLIALNLLVFVRELSDPHVQSFIHQWAVIPADISHLRNLDTLFSSMFLHGGWMHLLGNMLFLWVFGDNVEDRVGHRNYALFYLTSGIAACIAQVLLAPDSLVPLVGASGAISGVLAAYLIMFPKNHVKVLILARFLTQVPAYVMIGGWGIIQLASGIVSASHMATHGGVAYGAHVGGFAAGALLTALMPKVPPAALPVAAVHKAAQAAAAGSSPNQAQS